MMSSRRVQHIVFILLAGLLVFVAPAWCMEGKITEIQEGGFEQKKDIQLTPPFNGVKCINNTYQFIDSKFRDTCSLANGAILWETGWIKNMYDFGDANVQEARYKENGEVSQPAVPDSTVALARHLFGSDDTTNSFLPNYVMSEKVLQENGPVLLAQAINALRHMSEKLVEIRKNFGNDVRKYMTYVLEVGDSIEEGIINLEDQKKLTQPQELQNKYLEEKSKFESNVQEQQKLVKRFEQHKGVSKEEVEKEQLELEKLREATEKKVLELTVQYERDLKRIETQFRSQEIKISQKERDQILLAIISRSGYAKSAWNRDTPQILLKQTKELFAMYNVLSESLAKISGHKIQQKIFIQSLLQSEPGPLLRYPQYTTHGILLAYAYHILCSGEQEQSQKNVAEFYKQLDILVGTNLLTATQTKVPDTGVTKNLGTYKGLGIDGLTKQGVVLHTSKTREGLVSGAFSQGPRFFALSQQNPSSSIGYRDLFISNYFSSITSLRAFCNVEDILAREHLSGTTHPFVENYEKMIFNMTCLPHYPIQNQAQIVRFAQGVQETEQSVEESQTISFNDPEKPSVIDEAVSDDMENAVRNVIRILSYDAEQKKCTAVKLKSRLDKEQGFDEHLTNFLKKFGDPKKDDTPQAHEAWFALCANRANVLYGRKYKNQKIEHMSKGFLGFGASTGFKAEKDCSVYMALPSVDNFVRLVLDVLGFDNVNLTLQKGASTLRFYRECVSALSSAFVSWQEMRWVAKEEPQQEQLVFQKKPQEKAARKKKKVEYEKKAIDVNVDGMFGASKIDNTATIGLRLSDVNIFVQLPYDHFSAKPIDVIAMPVRKPRNFKAGFAHKEMPLMSLVCTRMFNWSHINNVLYLPSQPLIFSNIFALPLQNPHLAKNFVDWIVDPMTKKRMSRTEGRLDFFARSIFRDDYAPTGTFTHADVASIGWNVVERMPEGSLKQELKGKLLPLIKDKKPHVVQHELEQAQMQFEQQIAIRRAAEKFFVAKKDSRLLDQLTRHSSEHVRNAAKKVQEQMKKNK